MKKILSLIIIISLSLTLVSCDEPVKKSGVIYAFSTFIEIEFYGKSKASCEDVFDEIEKTYKEISKLADNFASFEGINNVYTINKTEELVEVDSRLIDLLDYSLYVKSETNGYFNPLIGNLSMIYKNLLSLPKITYENIPTEETLKTEIEKMNSTTLTIDKVNNTVKRTGEGTIDLGGIAKGYANNLVKDILERNDISIYLINAGFSSIIIGEKANSEFFNVGLKYVKNFSLKMKNKDLSTSSINEQNLEYNGEVYHHIISPLTGKPVNDYDTINLIGDDSALLDALTTAFMSMPINDIKRLCDDFKIDVIVFSKGEVLYQSKEVHVYE